MDENSAEIKLLMDYIDGTMDRADLPAFEQRLATDKELKSEAEALVLARASVQRYGLERKVADVRAQMKKQHEQKPGLLRTIGRNAMRIAASLVILLAITGIYEYATLSPAKLYNENYQAYTPAENRGSNESSLLEKAYRENRMNDVIQIFNNEPAHATEDYFFTANAYLQLGNSKEAILSFQSLMGKNRQSGTHHYQEGAEYYLGFSYLANSQAGKALPLFEKIHNDKNHAYHDRVSYWFLQKLRLFYLTH